METNWKHQVECKDFIDPYFKFGKVLARLSVAVFFSFFLNEVDPMDGYRIDYRLSIFKPYRNKKINFFSFSFILAFRSIKRAQLLESTYKKNNSWASKKEWASKRKRERESKRKTSNFNCSGCVMMLMTMIMLSKKITFDCVSILGDVLFGELSMYTGSFVVLSCGAHRASKRTHDCV